VIYGEHCQLHLESTPEHGTSVRVHIPQAAVVETASA
jgi:sensor histidine kinase YesM